MYYKHVVLHYDDSLVLGHAKARVFVGRGGQARRQVEE